MEAIAQAEMMPEKKSYLGKFRDFLKNKKMQVVGLGAAMIFSSGCMSIHRSLTLNDFFYGKYVQVTGEVYPGYEQKIDNMNENLNCPLIVYDSKGKDGKPLVMNLHEDARFGINRQALKRAKTGFNSHKYIVKAWGVVTSSKRLNMDLEFIAFTNRDGELISTVKTDIDPIYTLPGVAPIYIPNSSQPDLSIGFWSSWMPWYSMWNQWYGPDWDNDGIPNYRDPYPTIPFPAHPLEFGPNQGVIHNPYADLNYHNLVRAKESGLVRIIEPVRVTPAKEYINLFDHNKRVDEYILRQREQSGERKIDTRNIESKVSAPRTSLERAEGRMIKNYSTISPARADFERSLKPYSGNPAGSEKSTYSNGQTTSATGQASDQSTSTTSGAKEKSDTTVSKDGKGKDQ